VQILALNADSYPDAENTDPAYEGVTLSGAASLRLDDPEPQQIVHRGDDRVFALDTLPPTDPISGELTVGKTSDTMDAILTDDVSFAVGEMKMFGLGSDNRGDENQVAILAYQQTLDTDPDSADFGSRRWDFRLIPKCYVIPRAAGFEQDSPTQRMFTVRPAFIKKHLWGTAFTVATEGHLQAQLFRGISEYKPKVVAWKQDATGSNAEFTFPTASPAQSTDKIKVWVNGVLTTPETVGTTSIEFTSGSEPETAAMIVVLYEVE
jgi:hypothetical protein